MRKQTVLAKKRRGPAPTGKGVQVVVRLQPEQLKALDSWIETQDAALTRAQALRAMLAKETKARHSSLPVKTERHSPDEKTGRRAK